MMMVPLLMVKGTRANEREQKGSKHEYSASVTDSMGDACDSHLNDEKCVCKELFLCGPIHG